MLLFDKQEKINVAGHIKKVNKNKSNIYLSNSEAHNKILKTIKEY